MIKKNTVTKLAGFNPTAGKINLFDSNAVIFNLTDWKSLL
jgi:hypothetical protein